VTASTEHLRLSSCEGRLDVVIDRPHARNALSIGTLEEIAAVFTEYAADESLKIAVITGAGDKAFAAGGDVKQLSARRSAEDAAALFDLGRRATEAVRRFPVPVVASLNGVALGGGAELAVSCDFRLAARHAAIGFVHAQLALTTGFGGIASLQDLVGSRRALLMLVRGRIMAAEEARETGLVDMVAAEGETLENMVARFVEPMLERPAHLLRAMMALALAGQDETGRAAVAKVERERFISAWASEEHWAVVDKVPTRGR
jgi:enoyl-CoA hydratase